MWLGALRGVAFLYSARAAFALTLNRAPARWRYDIIFVREHRT